MAKSLATGDVVEMNEASTVEQLGEFIMAESRRMATSVWKIGHALNLAKKKAGHGKWADFLEKYFPQGHRTANRMMKVAKKLKLNDCEGKKAVEVFRMLGMAQVKKKRNTAAPVAVDKDGEDTIEDGLPENWEQILEAELAKGQGWLEQTEAAMIEMAGALGVVALSRKQLLETLGKALADQPKIGE